MTALRSLPARVRALDPLRADVLTAAALMAAASVDVWTRSAQGHSRGQTLALAVVLMLPVAFRRRAPLAAAFAFGCLFASDVLFDTYVSYLISPFVALTLMLYSSGRNLEGARMVTATVFLLGGVLVALVLSDDAVNTGDFFWFIVLLVPPVIVGRAVRNRARLRRELHEKRARLEADRVARARRAVEDERDRIASELQAVVAAGVSEMVVAAEGVPRMIETGQADAASSTLESIEETGREALAEMRRLLGVLRRDEDGRALAPQPSLSRVEALVGSLRAEGLEVELRVEGEPVELPQGVDLAGFRILQDALAAAAEDPDASAADVVVSYGEREVTLRIRDDRGAGPPDLARVVSMRQRAGLYGGVLNAIAPNGASGYTIEARLPYGGGA